MVIGGHFGGGDHFDGGDHFGGGTTFRISFQPDWQIDNGFFNRPIMERTQFLVHRWEAQNKDFGAVLKNDLTIIQFRLWRRLDTP